MKAKLIFDLSDPDDRIDFQRASNAGNLVGAVYDFDQWLRAQGKYENKDSISIGEVRDKLREFVIDNGVNWQSLEL